MNNRVEFTLPVLVFAILLAFFELNEIAERQFSVLEGHKPILQSEIKGTGRPGYYNPGCKMPRTGANSTFNTEI